MTDPLWEIMQLKLRVDELDRRISTSAEAEAGTSTSGVTALVKVTSAASGGGKYNGRILTFESDSAVSATGNLAESELGTLPGADDCLILNAAEAGQSTHDLTTGTPKSKVFVGIRKLHRSTASLPVFVINGADWENCT